MRSPWNNVNRFSKPRGEHASISALGNWAKSQMIRFCISNEHGQTDFSFPLNNSALPDKISAHFLISILRFKFTNADQSKQRVEVLFKRKNMFQLLNFLHPDKRHLEKTFWCFCTFWGIVCTPSKKRRSKRKWWKCNSQLNVLYWSY